MNINNFIKSLKTNQLKEANKLNVRDFDQIDKNSFVAYVDQGNESFDVQIILDDKKNIVSKTCDCKPSKDCIHQTAMLLFLANEKKIKPVVKKTTQRKVSETDAILNQIDNDTLKNWISNVLNTNKEVAFLFKNEFGQKNTHFDNDDVKDIIKLAIQSVIGKRRTIETNEVKKVVDNLKVSLKPVLEFIFSSRINDKTHDLIETIVDELIRFETIYYITSVRITRYIENIYDTLLKTLFNTKDLEIWKQNVLFYFSMVFDNETYGIYEFELIKKIYSFSEINELQRKYVLKLIEEKFTKIHREVSEDHFRIHIDFEMFFLNVFSENELFEKYQSKFKPRRFQNDYNILLIENLFKINEFEKVENYCIEQINNNSNQSYNIPYTKFLIDVYTVTKDLAKKATLLSNYGSHFYDFESYLFIKEHCSPIDFKKYRQKVLTNASYSLQSGDLQAFDFYYKIVKDDGDRHKLISLLEKAHNLEFFDRYKEEAFDLNPLDFLVAACSASVFTTENKLITKIANYIYQNTDTKMLHFFLTDRRIHEFSKLYKLLKDLDSNKLT